MSDNEPKRPAGHAVTIFQFVTILICAATLIITVRVHDKVARIPKTPADTTPLRNKDKDDLERRPANAPAIAKDRALSSPSSKNDAPTGNKNNGDTDAKSKTTNNQPLTRRSPIPEPGEVIVEPFDYAAPPTDTLQAPPVEPGQVIPWDQAHRYVDQEITVEGRIVAATIFSPSRGPDICFLNFTDEPRGGDRFYLIMWQDLFDAFPNRPDRHFEGKTIRATGRIDTYEGRPQMKIRKMQQITIVE